VTKQVEHRKDRREKRLCVCEGCPVVTGDRYRCPQHAEAHSTYCRKFYKRKRKRIKQMRKQAQT
jgi:hypothetical protein